MSVSWISNSKLILSFCCCRLCPYGKTYNVSEESPLWKTNKGKGKVDIANKQSFKQELWLRFQIDVDVDREKFTLLSYAQRVKGFSTEYEAQQT